MMVSITRKYSRFCGIDVAKNKHVACVIDREGQRWPVPTREESTFMILRALKALGFLDTLLPRGV